MIIRVVDIETEVHLSNGIAMFTHVDLALDAYVRNAV